jgi:peptidoglycan/LPS O-acetylase OafA/YrhL
MPLVVTVLYLAVLVAVASLSYRWIEQPGQHWFRGAMPRRDKRDKQEQPEAA